MPDLLWCAIAVGGIAPMTMLVCFGRPASRQSAAGERRCEPLGYRGGLNAYPRGLFLLWSDYLSTSISCISVEPQGQST
jgi:hypothetical protein